MMELANPQEIRGFGIRRDEAASVWDNSPEYQEALKIRLANSRGRVLIVEG
jgi:uncharacterized protein (DUF1330 family)